MRKIVEIRREIAARWRAIVARARCAPCRLPAVGNIRLVGSSHKVELARAALRVLIGVIYLAPSRSAFLPGARRTLCPFASSECARVCLGQYSGRLAMPASANARVWRTTLYHGARRLYRELFAAECVAHAARAARLGYAPAIRHDGASDTIEGMRLAPSMPGVQFYDYTKILAKWHDAQAIGNYHATFSFSGRNWNECASVLDAGGRVAAVFAARPGAPLPATFAGRRVIDGDISDARWLDDGDGVLVGLRFKAASRRAARLDDAGAFVIDSPPGLAAVNDAGRVLECWSRADARRRARNAA